MMHREGYHVISVAFLPQMQNLHPIMRKIRKSKLGGRDIPPKNQLVLFKSVTKDQDSGIVTYRGGLKRHVN